MNAIVEEMSGVITKERAVEIAQSGWWKDVDPATVARAQLNQDLLCMDFRAFHKAVTDALGRAVWTHEFVDPGMLLSELDGATHKPDMTEIMDKLIDCVGIDKVVVVKT